MAGKVVDLHGRLRRIHRKRHLVLLVLRGRRALSASRTKIDGHDADANHKGHQSKDHG
jgi:hypothetical protein